MGIKGKLNRFLIQIALRNKMGGIIVNIFLFVTANEHEREAFETRFIRKEERYILGKTYYMGLFGNYSVAYRAVSETQ